MIQDLGLIPSQLLGTSRQVWVYLPPGYNTGSNRYPVLYFHDGQGVFGSANPFNMEKYLTPLIQSGAVRPVIVVAIAAQTNPQARGDEYAIVPPAKGQLYAQMMVQEMVPMIDGMFRTLTTPANRATGGVSLGGVLSWYTAFHYPNVFGMVVSQSGVFHPASNAYDHVADAQALPGKLPFKLYYDRGTNDGESIHQIRDQEMRAVLLGKGMVEGVDFKYLLVQGAQHQWSDWAKRIDPFMRFLFPGP